MHQIIMEVLNQYLKQNLILYTIDYLESTGISFPNFMTQLEKDHKNDLQTIYEISRTDNTSFKVVFMNDKGQKTYTGLVKIKQKDLFQCEYLYQLLSN